MSSWEITRGITPQKLSQYLVSSGWNRRSDYPRRDAFVFVGPLDDNGESIDCVFSSDATTPGFVDDVARIVHSLAIVEHREPGLVADDIRALAADLLKIRLASEKTEDGSLPLRIAEHMIAGLRSLLVATARMEDEPAPAHWTTKKVDSEFGDACRLAQTELGSFVVNVEIPLQENLGESSRGRRVTERIMAGLSVVEHGYHPEQLVAAYKHGMNANMLEAMAQLRPDLTDYRLDVASRFSGLRTLGPTLGRAVRLEDHHFPLMEEGARQLRALNREDVKEYRGKVRTLVENTGQVNIDVISERQPFQL